MLLPAAVLDIVSVFRDVILSIFVESKFDGGGQMTGWTVWGICERISWGNIRRRLATLDQELAEGQDRARRARLEGSTLIDQLP